MERKLNKLPHCQTEAIVTFDKKEWTDANKKAFDKEKQNVTVKGFRKGKAPDAMLAEHVDQSKVMDAAINSLLPGAFETIVKEDKVMPVAQPAVSIEEIDNEHLVVKFVITTEPEVELGSYKDLKIGKVTVAVTDEMVKESIEKLAGDNATLKVADREAKDGDTAVIDFKGFVDGKEFEGGAAQNYELVLGSNTFIPGFEPQIVGHKAGETFDVNVKFPEQYAPALAGKDAKFEIVLHEVKEKILPELNDEFVKSLDIKGVETVAALQEKQRNELTVEATNNARRDYLTKLFAEINKTAKIDVPEAMVNDEVKARKDNFGQRLAQSGLTLEQYLQYIGSNEEAFEAQIKEETVKDVNIRTILREVAKLENIVVDDKTLDFEFAKMAEQYGVKVEDVKKAYAGNMDGLKYQLTLKQAEDFLFDHNN